MANAERFDESAYLFWQEGSEQVARACLEAADRLWSGKPDSGGVIEALVQSVRSALKQDLEKRLGWATESDPAGAGEEDQ